MGKVQHSMKTHSVVGRWILGLHDSRLTLWESTDYWPTWVLLETDLHAQDNELHRTDIWKTVQSRFNLICRDPLSPDMQVKHKKKTTYAKSLWQTDTNTFFSMNPPWRHPLHWTGLLSTRFVHKFGFIGTAMILQVIPEEHTLIHRY